MDLPHCYKNASLYQSTAKICMTCPFWLACSAHLGQPPATETKKRHFLKELLIQGVPPKWIDEAYRALFGVSLNSAKCARKYHARKHRESLR